MQNYLPQYNQARTNGYYNQPFVQQPQTQFKIIPVTSRNEADAFIPDINGTPLFFFNRGTNEVYLKQLDLQTGLAMFKEYTEKLETKKAPTITIEVLNEKIDSLTEVVNQLLPVTKKEKVTKNATE